MGWEREKKRGGIGWKGRSGGGVSRWQSRSVEVVEASQGADDGVGSPLAI